MDYHYGLRTVFSYKQCLQELLPQRTPPELHATLKHCCKGFAAFMTLPWVATHPALGPSGIFVDPDTARILHVSQPTKTLWLPFGMNLNMLDSMLGRVDPRTNKWVMSQYAEELEDIF